MWSKSITSAMWGSRPWNTVYWQYRRHQFAPRLYNKLPITIKLIDSLNTFKSHLTAFFFPVPMISQVSLFRKIMHCKFLVFLLISDPRRGCFMGFCEFIFFFFFLSFFFFFLFFFRRSCQGHISGTVARRDSRFSVLLGPAV